MSMHRIEKLRDNYEYPAARRVAFEDMCTLIFCEYLKLPGAVNMRYNQKGVEADPVEATDPETGDRKRFVYQVKYFDEGTKLSDRAIEFRSSIDAARELGAGVLMLFVNKDLLDTDRERAFEERLAAYAEKEAYAEDGTKLPAVRLDWWTLSKIEMILARPQYSHIPDRFLGSNIGAFYRAVREQFYGDEGDPLYGDVPLSECYIEPKVDVRDEDESVPAIVGRPLFVLTAVLTDALAAIEERSGYLSVRKWLESFVSTNGSVAVLCGEPGQGKTSLCRKAVCDFYEGSWLERKVHNVFCFSLNPANTDALANGQLNLYSFLSWGGDRTDRDHRIKPEYCRGALVFLDGFDELLEWKPGLDLMGFVQDHVKRFQQETGAHVVVTTRSVVVESDAKALRTGRKASVPVVRLQPITREQQLDWIARYAEHLRGGLAGVPGSSSQDRGPEAEGELSELRDYARRYGELDEGADFQKILGIPIIFRMAVAARYLPKAGESITRIYDDLFDDTWERHAHVDAGLREVTRAQLSRHALRVYADDAETAVVNDAPDFPWVFSFYMTHKEGSGKRNESRVGFLHRSLYQHFLAHEVVSWLERYAGGDDDENKFRDNLSYLARRRLGETTLGYIREMHDDAEDKETLNAAFDKAYEVLKETDGFLPSPNDATQIESVTPLERANNVFGNVVSVCSVCGYKLAIDKVSAHALQSFALDGCHLEEALLDGAHLEGAHLRAARLDGACLDGADLTRADLAAANLTAASIAKADLTLADLRAALFKKANLEEAHLEQARLEWTSFEWAHLTGTCFTKKEDLGMALLEGADLEGAVFKEDGEDRRTQSQARREVSTNLKRTVREFTVKLLTK